MDESGASDKDGEDDQATRNEFERPLQQEKQYILTTLIVLIVKVIQALEDPSWVEAMQEELLQFKLQKVWTLVDLPNGKRPIGTKWVFRNKKDKRGIDRSNQVIFGLCIIYGVYCVPDGCEECLLISPVDLEAFSDSDYAGASLDRKSTTGGCQFLGKRLISWQCKKQTIVANSTTEAEYVAAAHCCGQVLWIQNQMLDYGFNFMNTMIYIDNESTICIVKNPVFHSKTKHIEIRHHFIRDSYEKKLIQVIKIHTDYNVADLLTKAFDVSRFNFLIASIGLLNI
ncbi:hypothetical protein Tco_0969487 [Tanacetum coccineum]